MDNDPIMEATAGYGTDEEFEKMVKDSVGLPEAPASGTVRVYIDDFSTLITVRGTEANDVVRKVEFIVDYAKKKGWKSTWNKEFSQPQKAGYTPAQRRSTTPTDPNAPVCPTHNRPMKKFSGRYGEFWKCTAKIGDNEWCTEKVNIK